MVIAHDFAYVRPASLAEAVAALAEPGARVLAGGTDVVPWLRDEVIEPRLVVDIKAIPGLSGITVHGRRLEIGALATFSDLIESPLVRDLAPMLFEMAHHVASAGIRNRATVVGNLCSAVPSMDAAPALMVYDASVHLVGDGVSRTVALDDWFVGPKQTGLGAGEMVTAVSVGLPGGDHGGVFVKLSRYAGEDLAQANLAIVMTGDLDYRVAFGAVAPAPFRAAAIEQRLRGHRVDDDAIAAAVAMVPGSISPISDVRASAEYRQHMCGVMLARGLRCVAQRLEGAGPPYPANLI